MCTLFVLLDHAFVSKYVPLVPSLTPWALFDGPAYDHIGQAVPDEIVDLLHVRQHRSHWYHSSCICSSLPKSILIKRCCLLLCSFLVRKCTLRPLFVFSIIFEPRVSDLSALAEAVCIITSLNIDCL